MVQYQIVWFTGLGCMHDVSGWGNSTPLDTKMLFFLFQVHAQHDGCNFSIGEITLIKMTIK